MKKRMMLIFAVAYDASAFSVTTSGNMSPSGTITRVYVDAYATCDLLGSSV